MLLEVYYSNTTLVKVKSSYCNMVNSVLINSNTTLVKVKLDIPYLKII